MRPKYSDCCTSHPEDFPYNGDVRLAVDARKLTDFGIGTYLSALLRGLDERGDIQLSVVTRPGHEGRVGGLAPSARVLTTSAGGYTVAEHLKVPTTLWRERVDLVHIPHYVVPAFIPRPIVTTIHDVIQLFYPPSDSPSLALLYLRLTLRSALRRSRVVITVSRTSRRDLINLFKADPGRLMVVPNGADPELSARPSSAEVDALKEFYGLQAPLVLVVANDKPHKNLDVVLRSYHLALRRHRVPGQLVFVGGVEPSSRLAVRAEHLGIADRVRFLGRVPQSHLRALYHVAAVLLHVSLYEGFGLPVLEAMGAGLPVVTSNIGAMRELGEDAARLVNPLDVDEVARAVEQVLVDDPLRRRMVEAGRRRAERMTWERTIDETVAAYRRALGED
jgi:glycosyltransferase involved in cell wall biosynthesis